MSTRVVTDTGDITSVDEYAFYGEGLPEGWQWLEDMEPGQLVEILPSILRNIDDRIRLLETDHA